MLMKRESWVSAKPVTPVTPATFKTGARAVAIADWKSAEVASAFGSLDSNSAMNDVRPAP